MNYIGTRCARESYLRGGWELRSKSTFRDSEKFKRSGRESPSSSRLVTRDHLTRLTRLVFNFQMYFTPFYILIPPRARSPALPARRLEFASTTLYINSCATARALFFLRKTSADFTFYSKLLLEWCHAEFNVLPKFKVSCVSWKNHKSWLWHGFWIDASINV